MVRTVLLGSKLDWREKIFSKPAPRGSLVLSPAEFSLSQAEDDVTNYVLPLHVSDYELLRDSPLARRKCLLPDRETVALAEDKLAFNRWLIERGFAGFVPPLLDGERPVFPLILKKRVGEWGIGCQIIHRAQDLPAQTGEDYFLQAYVKGPVEYVSHTISLRGRVLFALSYRNSYGNDMFVKGYGVREVSVVSLRHYLHPAVRDILSALNYTGCACFNYKLENGRPQIFEMNPRLGGSFLRRAYRHIRAYVGAVDAQNSYAAYALVRTGRLLRCMKTAVQPAAAFG